MEFSQGTDLYAYTKSDDGGAFITGLTRSILNADDAKEKPYLQDIFISKLDKNLQNEWTRQIPYGEFNGRGPVIYIPIDISIQADGDLEILALTNRNIDTKSTIPTSYALIETDNKGDILKINYLETDHHLQEAVRFNKQDGEYVAYGWQYNYGAYAKKLNFNTDTISPFASLGDARSRFSDIDVKGTRYSIVGTKSKFHFNNTGFTGYIQSDAFGAGDLTGSILDSGNWLNTQSRLYATALTQDGGVVAGGYIWTDRPLNNIETKGSQDAFLAKFNSLGELDWTVQFGEVGNQSEHVSAVDQLEDGSYLAYSYVDKSYIDGTTNDVYGRPVASGTAIYLATHISKKGEILKEVVLGEYSSGLRHAEYLIQENEIRYTTSEGIYKVRTSLDLAPSDILISSKSFQENIPSGTTVAALDSTELDSNDTHTYSLVSGTGDTDNRAFTVDGDQLKINISPDFETKNSYSVRLQTKDSGGLTFEKAFTLSVNDLNENPTDLQVSSKSFDENISAGSVVAELSSNDEDSGDTHTYSLVSGSRDIDNSSFTINGNELRIKESPDFETKSSYSIRLQTKDSAGLTFEKAFTLSVIDQKESRVKTTLISEDSQETHASDYSSLNYNSWSDVKSWIDTGNIDHIDLIELDSKAFIAAYTSGGSTSLNLDVGIKDGVYDDGKGKGKLVQQYQIPFNGKYKERVRVLEACNDTSGNLYLVLQSRNTGRWDEGALELLKISLNGEISFRADISDKFAAPVTDLGIDKNGDVILVGYTESPDTKVFTQKHNGKSGELVWVSSPFEDAYEGGSIRNSERSLSILDDGKALIAGAGFIYPSREEGLTVSNYIAEISIDTGSVLGLHKVDDGHYTENDYWSHQFIANEDGELFFKTFKGTYQVGGVGNSLDGSYEFASLVAEESSVFSAVDARDLVEKEGESIVIPDGKTSIEDWAFFSMWTLKGLEIPNSVTSIGEGSFKGNYISSLVLPDSVESIGAASFAHNKLERVQLSSALTTIPFRAFTDNQLTSIEIPDTVKTIEAEAFVNNNLTSLVIPAGVKSLSDNAFDKLKPGKEGVYSSAYISSYAFEGQYSVDTSFAIEGKNKFGDVIKDLRPGNPVLDIELTSDSNGDAFFLHDTYSEYPASFTGVKDSLGREYIPRVQNIRSLFAGDGDDLVDLTSTETREIYGGVKRSGGGVANVYGGRGDDVVLGGDGNVFGEDGDDTLISHHSATMTGGNGTDIFGFLATPEMQDEITGLNREPIHKITDFDSGIDSIRFYVSSELTQTGSMETGNKDHITKTVDGDIEWMYYHNGSVSAVMTVEMNGRQWGMDDLQFISYDPITPELV